MFGGRKTYRKGHKACRKSRRGGRKTHRSRRGGQIFCGLFGMPPCPPN